MSENNFNQNECHNYVFLHALGMNATGSKKLEQCLGEQINSFDFPGYGLRSLEHTEVTTIDDSVRVLEEELKSRGIENPVLIGHSYGGFVALTYTLNHPVRKLILVNSSPRKVKDVDEKLLKSGFKEKQFVDYSEVSWGSDLRFISADARTTLPEINISYWRGVANYNVTDCLGKIICPVLVIAGEKDSIIAKEFTEEFRKLSDCVVKYIPGGHYLPITNALEVAKVIRGDKR